MNVAEIIEFVIRELASNTFVEIPASDPAHLSRNLYKAARRRNIWNWNFSVTGSSVVVYR